MKDKMEFSGYGKIEEDTSKFKKIKTKWIVTEKVHGSNFLFFLR